MLSGWIEERWSGRPTMRPSIAAAAAATVIRASVALVRRAWRRPRRRIRVSRVSEEWLRAFAKESSKHQHRDGP
jgi:hypothetical protein